MANYVSQSSPNLLHCSYCDFCSHQHGVLLKHTRDCHANDSNFRIYCSVCDRPFKKWDSFKKHLHREHGDVNIEVACDAENDDQSEQDMDLSYENQFNLPEVGMKWESAKFLLHVTEENGLTYSGVEKLCECVQQYSDDICKVIREKLKRRFPDTMDVTLKDELLGACDLQDLFGGLQSRNLREKYYQDNFNYVPPTPVLMGSEWDWTVENGTGERVLAQIDTYGYIVDLLDGLKTLLSNPDVRREIHNPHINCGGETISDFCDGNLFKTHPLFASHPEALQFIVYHDDIEVANALGSKAGAHKLGVFYYSLGNIRPIFRSAIRTIQLIAVAKSADIRKYGCEKILKPFIDQINSLGNDNGVTLNLNGEELLVHGAVLCLCGDIPASCYLGGFKEGVGLATRKCRRCLATSDDIKRNFHASQFIHHDKDSHEDQLKLIKANQKHSVTYGINGPSCLSDLKWFDITTCIPFDLMHTIYEGIASHHLNLLFQHLINDCSYFSLDKVNHLIKSHQYGYSESDTKPCVIKWDPAASKFHFILSASQMMTLVELLPFIVGPFVETSDHHWECFLLFWDICSISSSFEVKHSDTVKLAWTIETYLEAFRDLYPSASILPKMHYLLHFPEQLALFGPLRNHWCMRFESKNAQIKGFVSKCFKNVPFTVATHHQQWMAFQLLTRPGQTNSNYLYHGDDIISGSHIVLDSFVDQISALCGEPNHDGFIQVIRAKGVKIHGIEYRVNAIIRIKRDSAEDGFTYAHIDDLYIYQSNKIFLTTVVNVMEINPHIKSIKICITSEKVLCTFTDLFCKGVLHCKERDGDMYIIEKQYNCL